MVVRDGHEENFVDTRITMDDEFITHNVIVEILVIRMDDDLNSPFTRTTCLLEKEAGPNASTELTTRAMPATAFREA